MSSRRINYVRGDGEAFTIRTGVTYKKLGRRARLRDPHKTRRHILITRDSTGEEVYHSACIGENSAKILDWRSRIKRRVFIKLGIDLARDLSEFKVT